MTHVYLTETEVKTALKARVITEREAQELTRVIKRYERKKKAHAKARAFS
jgi:hypothetical protein